VISAADHFTYTGASSTDSQNLRALQVAVTKMEAAASGDAIAGAVENAIDDAFLATGGVPIFVGPNGVHFNFTAEPQRDAATQEALDALAYANLAASARATTSGRPMPGSTGRSDGCGRASRNDWRVGANSTPGVRPSRCQEQL
jgi:hypothetical protein